MRCPPARRSSAFPNRSPRLGCSAARSASTIFAGQYLQSPAPLGGGLVTTERFKRYAANELPQSYDRIVQSWDTAHKATELSDFSVCPTGGIKGKILI
jgi:phage terminase large subunit-like protein